jgi:hypothetical protein
VGRGCGGEHSRQIKVSTELQQPVTLHQVDRVSHHPLTNHMWGLCEWYHEQTAWAGRLFKQDGPRHLQVVTTAHVEGGKREREGGGAVDSSVEVPPPDPGG